MIKITKLRNIGKALVVINILLSDIVPAKWKSKMNKKNKDPKASNTTKKKKKIEVYNYKIYYRQIQNFRTCMVIIFFNCMDKI